MGLLEVNMLTLISIGRVDKKRLATWQLVGWILLRALPEDTSKGVK